MIQAIIDVGSNTVRMAVYSIEREPEKIELLMKKKDMVGLAGYLVDNVMTVEGIDRACVVLAGYREFLERLSIERVAAFTTAALRNCKNSAAAVSEISSRTGIPLKVISGEEEAELDFIGATHGLRAADGMVVDIGGGSTELVLFRNHEIIKKVSMHIGSLGYRRDFVRGLFPTAEEIGRMEEKTRAELAALTDFAGVKAVDICGIGGTFKGAKAIYDEVYGGGVALNGMARPGTFGSEYLEILLRRFTAKKLTEEDTLVLLKAIPERLETVLPGMVIAKVICDYFGCQHITYSDSGVREGFIYREIIG